MLDVLSSLIRTFGVFQLLPSLVEVLTWTDEIVSAPFRPSAA